jgi:hypothetical protein
LVFESDPEVSLAWETNSSAADLTGFINSLLEAASPSGPFLLAVRGGAPWFTGTRYDEGPHVEQLRDRIVGTLAIPRDFDGALRFELGEWRDVVMLVATFMVYCWCIADDLELVSGDGSTCLMTSHHGYVSVHADTQERLRRFEAAMIAAGYHPAGSEAS